MELVPIKVKIKRNTAGRGAVYPNFNTIDPAVRNGVDWSVFVDRHGGWHYDKKSRLGESDVQNPDPDSQFGALLVPEDFADAALVAFPNDVEAMTESQFESFYDNRAHDHEPDVVMDTAVLVQLRAKYGVAEGVKLVAEAGWDQADIEALDPNSPTPGVVTNPRKTFARFKTRRGLTVKDKTNQGMSRAR